MMAKPLEQFDEQKFKPFDQYFDTEVPEGGYRWWYADVISDDGKTSFVVIGFIGSVFSPYYARARRKQRPDPYNHCAINAVIYQPGKKHWAMTERSGQALNPQPNGIAIGPSSLSWQDGDLIIDIEEWTNPFPRRLRGTVRITPGTTSDTAYGLHTNGKHWWWPVAPRARAVAEFTAPGLSFTGSAYIDSNFGAESLESGFDYWDWTRAANPAMDPAITYHTRQRDGHERRLSLSVGADGTLAPTESPGIQTLNKAVWRVERAICTDLPVRAVRTLEDTPFYARSVVDINDQGGNHLMHESLSLDRFRQRWVQTLLPFRMPRRSHWQR
ncbi:MAG: carotenoid 1,2-hydratase [Woeseiaceae bacterium]